MLQKRKVARSLFVVQDLKHGDVLTEANVRSIRPGYGLHPRHLRTFWVEGLGAMFRVASIDMDLLDD